MNRRRKFLKFPEVSSVSPSTEQSGNQSFGPLRWQPRPRVFVKEFGALLGELRVPSFYVDFHTKCENPHIAIVQFSRLGRQFP